jgi:hypothetical protein
MSEESKKIEKIEHEAKATELSEQDLDNVAGGVTGNDGGCTPNPFPRPKGSPQPPEGAL